MNGIMKMCGVSQR